MIELKSYGAVSNQGPHLSVNEDAVHVDLHNNVFLVFDGFGGVNIGDKVVENLKTQVLSFYTKVGGDPDSTFPFFYSYKYLLEGNALINSMHLAHDHLKKDNSNKDLSKKGGASMLGAVFADNIFTMASTGNCMAYLFRSGVISQIMCPDVLSPILPIRGFTHSDTVPLSGFGLFDDLHIQLKELRIQTDDIILLMTDGAYSRINDDEIKHIFENQNKNITEKISKVFDTVNSRGNLDNQSLVALEF